MDTGVGLDPEKLLVRISDGETLSSEEVEELAEVLRAVDAAEVGRKRSVDEIYSYIVVVGRAKLTSLQHSIEKFLDVRDALTVALVLETLCLEWKATDAYLERVISFALGVSWDEDQDVQQAAIKILGEYLFETLAPSLHGETSDLRLSPPQHRVLELLLSIFSDPELESWTRQSSYFSLCRADGRDWDRIPSECVQLRFEKGTKDIDWSMIEGLEEVLTHYSSEEESESSSSSGRALRGIDSGSTNPPGMR